MHAKEEKTDLLQNSYFSSLKMMWEDKKCLFLPFFLIRKRKIDLEKLSHN
jgi:hypothetical protein